MATPPKLPPAKAGFKKVAPTATPVAKKKLFAPAPVEKTAPFVIESGSLSAFVDKNDSAFPLAAKSTVKTRPASEVVKPLPVDKAPVAETSVATTSVTETPAAAPVELPVAEIDAPTPPQPVVVEPVIAAIETAADWHAPKALEGHPIMNEAIETGKKFAEDAKTRLQSIVGDFNEKAKGAAEKSSKVVEELTEITKGNVEALVESSKIAAKGVESIGQSAAEYSRASFEKTSATLKSFASVKSPVEFFQLQSELFTSAFDTLAAESSRTSEALLKLAGEIAQPLSNRASVVSDKLKALAA